MTKQENWLKDKVPDGKVILPEDYDGITDQAYLDAFGFVRLKDIKITNYDEYLEECLKNILNVPFDTLKPYIGKAINKYFPTKEEFQKCFESLRRDARYLQEANCDNPLFLVIKESFDADEKDIASLSVVMASFDSVERARVAYSRAVEDVERLDNFTGQGYRVAGLEEAYDREDQSAEEYNEAQDLHKQTVDSFTRIICPELAPKPTKPDANISV